MEFISNPANLIVVALVTGAAYLAMWFEDRDQRYLFWWGMSQLTVLAMFVARLFIADGLVSGAAADIAYLLPFALIPFTLIKGASYFPPYALSRGIINSIGALLIITPVLAYFFLYSISIPRILCLLGILGAFVYICYKFWTRDIFERIASVIAGLCAASLVYVAIAYAALSIAPQFKLSRELVATASLASLSTPLMALVLIVVSYRRSRHETRAHLDVLTLSHDVMKSLQDVSSVAEIGDRIIPVIVNRQGWRGGALLLLDEENQELVTVSYHGDNSATFASLFEKIPVNKSISGVAIKSRKIMISRYPDDQRSFVPAQYQSFTQSPEISTITLVAIPLLYDQQAVGVLVLVGSDAREIGKQAMSFFEMVGHVVAISLTNVMRMENLKKQAGVDSLTRLGNRSSFHEYIHNGAAEHIAVILFDLDRFKEINDTLGHGMGDQVLVRIAHRLTEMLNTAGAGIFRLGGDEFVVVFLNPQKSPHALAQALLETIHKPMLIHDVSLKITASIGVVDTFDQGKDSHEMLRCADLAMYQAKQGHVDIAIYEETTDNKVRERVELLTEVSQALENNQFLMYYQPIIDMRTGLAKGAEALVRWKHNDRGLLTAAEFMPYVETTDHIKLLSYRIVDLTLNDLQDLLREEGEFKVSLNLSTRNLFDRNLPDYLWERIQFYGLSPAHLVLEITETVLMTDPEVSEQILHRLSSQGFTIALDDFGTGHSSLSYLTKFPIDIIKIDRSFIKKIIDDPLSRSIVKATINLGHELGCAITAEGIESQDVADMLEAMTCENGQGYLFSEPVPLVNFQRWYQEQTVPSN